MSKINYKKISQDFTDHVKADEYDNPKTLKVEFTRFVSTNLVNGGRNNQNTLVELQTRVIESNGIHIETSRRSGLIDVYISSRVSHQSYDCSSEGYRMNESGVMLKVRTPKNKYEVINLWDADEYNTSADKLARLFGYKIGKEFDLEGFKWWRERYKNDLVDIKTGEGLKSDDELNKEFTHDLYVGISGELLRLGVSETFVKLVEFLGFSISKIFNFTNRYYFMPEFVNETRQSIEFGWHTNSTYNSLPLTLKITKLSKIKTESLEALGIENAGYYSHYDRFNILPEHVQEVKAFSRKFQNSKRRTYNRIKKMAA